MLRSIHATPPRYRRTVGGCSSHQAAIFLGIEESESALIDVMPVCSGCGRAREYSGAISQLEIRQSILWSGEGAGDCLPDRCWGYAGSAAWHGVKIAKQAARASLGLGFVFTWIGGGARLVHLERGEGNLDVYGGDPGSASL